MRKWFKIIWWVFVVLFVVGSVSTTAACVTQGMWVSAIISAVNTCTFVATVVLIARFRRKMKGTNEEIGLRTPEEVFASIVDRELRAGRMTREQADRFLKKIGRVLSK
jgi:hypothetical protein